MVVLVLVVRTWLEFVHSRDNVCVLCVIFLKRENRMYEFVFQENVCVCVYVCVGIWNFGMLYAI